MYKTALSEFTDHIFKWAGLSHLRALVLLALLSLTVFLPGFFSLQPMDRDEPRFAQATKQMLETGDFVSIRFQGEARNKKPVGIYWLQAGAVAMAEAVGLPQARERIWLYRLPSLMAAISAVCLTYWAALAVTDRRKALIAGMVLASCLLLGVEARLAKTDAMLAATVIACLGVLMRLYLRRSISSAHILIFWVALAIGILIKGPLTPAIVALTMIVLSYKERSVQWMAPLRFRLGLILCFAIVSPWFVMIGLKTHGAFFSQSIGQDMMDKMAQGQESHGAPPLTYFVLFWITAWPMAPLALLVAPAVWMKRRNPDVFVLLAWLFPTLVMFELVPTKLPHYVLPIYPAIAILIGAHSDEIYHASARWLRIVFTSAVYCLPVMLVVASVALWGQTIFPLLPFASIAAPIGTYGAGAVIFAGGGFWVLHLSRRTLDSSPLAEGTVPIIAAACCFFAMIYSTVLTSPAFAPFALSQRLVAARAQILKTTACAKLPTLSAGFAEPSFVFLTETAIQFGDGRIAAAFLKAERCRMVFVTSAEEPAFLTALEPELVLHPVVRVEGTNIGSGKRMDIGAYVRQ